MKGIRVNEDNADDAVVPSQLPTDRLDRHKLSRQAELRKLTKEELADLVLKLEGLSKTSTDSFRQPDAIRSFNLKLSWEAREYIRLPISRERWLRQEMDSFWRIALVSFDLAHPIIGADLYGNITIGRSGDGVFPDLDLSAYEASAYGVSREHALLKIDADNLSLMDLSSTNGTRLNGARLDPETPHVLKGNDIIIFGGLQFQIRFLNVTIES